MKKLEGIITAIVTPFNKDGSVNFNAVDPLLDFQISAGISGVVVSGTNGEGTSLSVSERKALLEVVLARRRNLSVVAGTGAASISDAVELTRHASLVGADAVLVLPPFFFHPCAPEGLASYYRAVLDVSGIAVFLYNIPKFSRITITDELLRELAGHPKLAGLKDSTGDWNSTGSFINNWPNLTVLPGSDELLSRSFCAGSIGAISGTSNAFPELAVHVYNACQTGLGIEKAQASLDLAKNIMMDYPFIAYSKSVLTHRGLPQMWVRPPLVDLSQAQKEEMISRLREAKLL